MAAIPANMDREHRRSIQMALNELTKSFLTVDGDFGPKSIAVLKQYQTQCKIACTGIYDEATQARLEPFIKAKYLTEDDYVRAAKALGVDVASIKTVVEVEAGGDGFLPSGDCDILFERHKFYGALVKRKPPIDVASLCKQVPNIVSAERGGYMGGQKEWNRINMAITIDRAAALESASWGMFQIMGFNYALCGYKNVEAMVTDMKQSEGKQLDAFVSFVINNKAVKNGKTLLQALRTKDWATFALIYNGPAYKENKYDTKLADAYKGFTKA